MLLLKSYELYENEIFLCTYKQLIITKNNPLKAVIGRIQLTTVPM